MKTFKFYSLDTEIDFGMFKGETIREILYLRDSYINFCLLKVYYFGMSNVVLNEIKKIKPEFTITEEENESRIIKQKQWYAALKKNERKNNNTASDAHDYTYYGCEDDIGDGYNDNLDMDQQSEDFYNTEVEPDYDYSDSRVEEDSEDDIIEEIELDSNIIRK